jgi:hypothetical protein
VAVFEREHLVETIRALFSPICEPLQTPGSRMTPRRSILMSSRPEHQIEDAHAEHATAYHVRLGRSFIAVAFLDGLNSPACQ